MGRINSKKFTLKSGEEVIIRYGLPEEIKSKKHFIDGARKINQATHSLR